MYHPSGSHKIAIAVRPPVYAESLVRVLQRPDLELVIDDAPGDYDGVVVSGADSGDERTAPVVIRLPEPRDAGIGSVVTGDGRRDVSLHTLEEVRGLIDELWPRERG